MTRADIKLVLLGPSTCSVVSQLGPHLILKSSSMSEVSSSKSCNTPHTTIPHPSSPSIEPGSSHEKVPPIILEENSNSEAPIQRMPEELLALVCSYALETDFSPWSLMLVSRPFHNAIVSTPTIWSWIAIFEKRRPSYERLSHDYSGNIFRSSPCFSVHDLELALSRAKSTPLEIIIDYSWSNRPAKELEAMFYFLWNHGDSTRWRSLTILSLQGLLDDEQDEFGNPVITGIPLKFHLNNLTELHLKDATLSLLDCLHAHPPPELRYACIGSGIQIKRLGEHNAWLRSIRELSIEWSYDWEPINHIARVLSRCVTIEELTLEGLSASDESNGIEEGAILSERLRKMSLRGYIGFIAIRISTLTHLTLEHVEIVESWRDNYLELPALQVLSWVGNNHRPLRMIKSPSLQTLELDHSLFEVDYTAVPGETNYLEVVMTATWHIGSSSVLDSLLHSKHNLILKFSSTTPEFMLAILRAVGDRLEELHLVSGVPSGSARFYNGLELPLRQSEYVGICPNLKKLYVDLGHPGDNHRYMDNEEDICIALRGLAENRSKAGRPVFIRIQSPTLQATEWFYNH